jgi:hypothetical protein
MGQGLMRLKDLFKEAHEEFCRALIVLGDSPILLAAALILLFLLLRDLAGESPMQSPRLSIIAAILWLV